MNKTAEKTSTMKWYIVRAQSTREKSVSEKLIKESDKGFGGVVITYIIKGLLFKIHLSFDNSN